MTTFTQTSDGFYPDTLAIISGYFDPKDKTRCLVCGKMLKGMESTCGKGCFKTMCKIQNQYSESSIARIIERRKAQEAQSQVDNASIALGNNYNALKGA